MRPRPATVLLAVLSAASTACSGGGEQKATGAETATRGANTTAATSATSTAEPAHARTECTPNEGPPGGMRVADPNGPYHHQVRLGRLDGTSVSGDTLLAEHASVPDGVALDDGDVAVYYISGEDGYVHHGRWDGEAFGDQGLVELDGITSPVGVVDPDVYRLDDGTFRMAYVNVPQAMAGPDEERVVCLADSGDGHSFTSLGVALRGAGLTDPSLTRLGSTWYLAASHGPQTVVARSDDGLSFSEVATFDGGGVPEITPVDGALRLFACTNGTITAWSSPDGTAWASMGTALDHDKFVCDPSVVAGTDLFVYKTADNDPTAGMVMPPPVAPGK